MRTIFHAGPFPATDGLRLFRLGQTAAIALTKEDRDDLLESLTNALARGKAVDVFVSTQGAQDPSLESILGKEDARRFWLLSEEVVFAAPTVRGLVERLEDPEPDAWLWPTDAETESVQTWTSGIDEMIDIINRHYQVPESPEAAPVPAPPPEPTILGIPQETVLIGSAVAVGVSALIYVLA